MKEKEKKHIKELKLFYQNQCYLKKKYQQIQNYYYQK